MQFLKRGRFSRSGCTTQIDRQVSGLEDFQDRCLLLGPQAIRNHKVTASQRLILADSVINRGDHLALTAETLVSSYFAARRQHRTAGHFRQQRRFHFQQIHPATAMPQSFRL